MRPLLNRPRPLPLFLDLVREVAQHDPSLAVRALEGLAAYQRAERSMAGRPHKLLAQQGRVRLIDYGGDGPPVLFIPSIINPHFILDLHESNSLIRHIQSAGFRSLLVDWGRPLQDQRDESLSDLIADYLAPLVEQVSGAIEPPHLVGYCLGGTMALASACLAPVRSLSLIAAPWHFDRYGEDRHMLDRLWTDNETSCAQLGLVPMEVLQTAFWRMDPERTVKKYARLVESTSAQLAQFVALEDWANDGEPLTFCAGEELFIDLFRDNRPGSRQWIIADRTISPDAVPCPARQFVSTRDRIVPLAACPDGIETITSPAGHVGMVVGSSARSSLWDPLANWLSQVQHKP